MSAVEDIITALELAITQYSERELARIDERADVLRRLNVRADDFMNPVEKQLAARVAAAIEAL